MASRRRDIPPRSSRADAQDDPSAGERLRRGHHLGQMRRVAEAVAEDLVGAELVGIAREGEGEERPALGDLVRAVLDMVGKPERVEGADRLIQIREELLHEPGPDIETYGYGHRRLLRTSWIC